MKQSASEVIKRVQRFQIVLIGEGLLVGAVAGLVVLLYRIVLEHAGQWLQTVLAWAGGNPGRIAGWFTVLVILAYIVAKLVEFEPMISGSGIPQLEGEMTGKFDPIWYKVLWAKFVGGFLCLLGGLALGREGPSIQLGAMAGKGVSRGFDRGRTEERYLLTCGASAGLAAAFHAPLAGIMFSLEEVHKNFSVSVLVSVMAASLTADYLASLVTGMESVFHFDVAGALPQGYYWLLLLLGIVMGVLGAFYNWFTLKVQDVYRKVVFPNTAVKILIPFLCAGILGFTMPELLGSGHDLIEDLAGTDVALGTILFLFVGRFLFSALCFGSGAPGGIFFPLLVQGALMGGVFALVGTQYLGLDTVYMSNIVILAMAGYFSAIVRAPLTGIILIFEMTGSMSQMLSLAVVSISAYIVAAFLKSEPIYESLLSRLTASRGVETGQEGAVNHGNKVLMNYVIPQGCQLDNVLVSEVRWPKHCLLVAVERGTQELLPRGQTRLLAGDTIVTMTDERDAQNVHEDMGELCKERFGQEAGHQDIGNG